MPKNKFVKQYKKSKEFRNRSKSRSKGEITMYVGALDDPDEETDQREILVTPAKDSNITAHTQDRSKIVISAQGAAKLNL